jgi:hypothetical protein
MTRFADLLWPGLGHYVSDRSAFQDDRRAEPSVRAMEEAALPEICVLGSDLLSRLAAWYVGAIPPHLLLPHLVAPFSAERHLTPHAGRFTNIILYHLELVPPP